jgi:hypothetical protein
MKLIRDVFYDEISKDALQFHIRRDKPISITVPRDMVANVQKWIKELHLEKLGIIVKGGNCATSTYYDETLEKAKAEKLQEDKYKQEEEQYKAKQMQRKEYF